MMGEQMNRKRIVLIDGNSMIANAFYGMPSNAADAVIRLIKGILERREADYLAITFSAEDGGGTLTEKALLQQKERLKELSDSLSISVLSEKGYESAELLASLAKSCETEGGDIQIISEDKRLLQLVRDHVTVHIPSMGEEGLVLKSYSPADIEGEFGLEPVKLKGVFSLTKANGIGEKTACQLIKQYESIKNLFDHLEEVESLRIKEILKATEKEIKEEEKRNTLRDDCSLRLDDSNSISEAEIRQIMDMDFVPADFPDEENQESLEDFPVHLVTDFSEAETIFSKCLPDSRLGLHLVIEDKAITALSLCLGQAQCYCIIPQGFLTSEYLAGKAEEISKKAGHVTVLDLKSQLPFLKLEAGSPVFDAGVAAYLLNPLKDSYAYYDLAADYLDMTIPSRADLIGKSSIGRALEEKRDAAVSCIGYMSYVAYRCGEVLPEELKKNGMDTLFYEIELPLIYSLYSMESAGIKVERDRLKEYGDRLKVRIMELEQKIYEETGETFNINSPKQLGEILFDHMKIPGGKKTKTGYSTAADVLEKLAPDYPVVNLILDYRQLTKLKSTYADGLAAYIGPDERIHGTFNQTITATGRISSTEPNLQNIPVRMELGREIRKVFVPKEGCVFVDADYSQIELRVLAHMSGDQRLINAYKQAEDIHAITASEVFHVPLNEVTSLQRRNAKAVNFGIVYGISSFGLSEGLSITRKEASEYIEKYFETYPGVKKFLDGLVAEAKEKGYAVSMFGRRRPVPELKSSNFMQRNFGERVAMNSPIQGTAADIMKIAMIRVDQALKKQGLKSRIVLQIHDELLIETYRDELEQVKELLTEEMKHAADLLVSLEVEANVGESWFDAK
ncbi:DNA polymerase I [Lacrimispora sp. JR3]|uniref:DNA polymerase I n=1 Tax=Lacrimispora sinapis TaxID=3111456 RepID=UPI00374A32EF